MGLVQEAQYMVKVTAHRNNDKASHMDEKPPLLFTVSGEGAGATLL